MPPVPGEGEEVGFAEFRRKVRGAEVLSAAMERLLKSNSIQWQSQRHHPEWPGLEVRL